jgi:hypothetical protein
MLVSLALGTRAMERPTEIQLGTLYFLFSYNTSMIGYMYQYNGRSTYQ